MAVSGAREKRSNIWGQLAVSACVLLLPPLGMVAGLLYLGSSPQEVATTAEAAPGGASQALAAARPEAGVDGKGSFGLASAAGRPTAAEPKSAVAQPAVTQPAAAQPALAARPAAPQPQPAAPPSETAQRAAAGKPGAKDAARFVPSAPVTLVHGGAASEPTAVAEATPATEKPAETPAATAPASTIAVPDEAANAAPPPNNTARKPRHEARAAPRTRHVPTLSEIFLGPARRSH